MAKHPVGRRNGCHKLKALVSSLMSACKSQRRQKLRSLDRSTTVGRGTGMERFAVVGHHAIDAKAEHCAVGNKVVKGFPSTSL